MQVTLCRMLVPVLPKELSVFPQPATNPVWPVKGRMIHKSCHDFKENAISDDIAVQKTD